MQSFLPDGRAAKRAASQRRVYTLAPHFLRHLSLPDVPFRLSYIVSGICATKEGLCPTSEKWIIGNCPRDRAGRGQSVMVQPCASGWPPRVVYDVVRCFL